jgi:hypothetical protein
MNNELTQNGFKFLGFAESSSIGLYFNKEKGIIAHDFGLIDYYKYDETLKKGKNEICGINKQALKAIEKINEIFNDE